MHICIYTIPLHMYILWLKSYYWRKHHEQGIKSYSDRNETNPEKEQNNQSKYPNFRQKRRIYIIVSCTSFMILALINSSLIHLGLSVVILGQAELKTHVLLRQSCWMLVLIIKGPFNANKPSLKLGVKESKPIYM